MEVKKQVKPASPVKKEIKRDDVEEKQQAVDESENDSADDLF